MPVREEASTMKARMFSGTLLSIALLMVGVVLAFRIRPDIALQTPVIKAPPVDSVGVPS